MTIHKTWNVRDQTTKTLKKECEKCYKMIIKYNQWIAKATTTEETKKLVKEKYAYKEKANDIEIELMKRRANGEKTF